MKPQMPPHFFSAAIENRRAHENEVSENTVFLSMSLRNTMRDSAMVSIARYVTMPSPPPQMTLLTEGTGRNRKCWRNEVHDGLNDTPLRSIPGIKNKVEGAVVAAPLTDSEGQEGPDHKLGLRPTDRDRPRPRPRSAPTCQLRT